MVHISLFSRVPRRRKGITLCTGVAMCFPTPKAHQHITQALNKSVSNKGLRKYKAEAPRVTKIVLQHLEHVSMHAYIIELVEENLYVVREGCCSCMKAIKLPKPNVLLHVGDELCKTDSGL